MLIKELGLQSGQIISCSIDGLKAENAMVVFEQGQMYLFNNVKRGGQPDNFHQLNTLYNTAFLAAWACGNEEGELGYEIKRIVKTDKIIVPKIYKPNDLFLDREGNKYYVEKDILKNNVVLLKNTQGKICKMVSRSELDYLLFTPEKFKKTSEKDLFDIYYGEDLFQKMKFVKYKAKGDAKDVRLMTPNELDERQIRAYQGNIASKHQILPNIESDIAEFQRRVLAAVGLEDRTNKQRRLNEFIKEKADTLDYIAQKERQIMELQERIALRGPDRRGARRGIAMQPQVIAQPAPVMGDFAVAVDDDDDDDDWPVEDDDI